MPEPMTLINVVCEELARIDSGFATACICSIWGLVPVLFKPHRNMELLMEFGPKFCGDRAICWLPCYDRAFKRGGY